MTLAQSSHSREAAPGTSLDPFCCSSSLPCRSSPQSPARPPCAPPTCSTTGAPPLSHPRPNPYSSPLPIGGAPDASLSPLPRLRFTWFHRQQISADLQSGYRIRGMQLPTALRQAAQALRDVGCDWARQQGWAARRCVAAHTASSTGKQRSRHCHGLWRAFLPLALVVLRLAAAAEDAVQAVAQSNAETISWLRDVRVYVYDLAEIGMQSPLDIFQPNGSFCNGRCPAQHQAPIWGADFCNYGYGQPITEPQTAAHVGPLWTNNDDAATTFFLYTRLMHSKYRTTDPDKANLFFVPLYLSLFCRAKYSNLQAQCGLRFTKGLAKKFWTWLYEQPHFQRSRGRDHFLILSKTYGRAYRCDPLSAWVQTKYMGHPQPGWAGFPWWGADNMQKLAHSNSFSPDSGWKLNAHPIPYPSAVHYVPSGASAAHLGLPHGGGAPPWRPHELFNRTREYLASYVGTLWRGLTSPSGTSVYWKLKIVTGEVCYDSPSCLANILDAPPQQPGTPRQPWASFLPKRVKFGAFAAADGQSGVDRWLLDRGIGAPFPQLTYLHSTFCLTPPGDGPTRKGLFDAMLFGCIPVVYDIETLKYPWFLPRSHIESFAVIFDAKGVASGRVDVIAQLRRITEAEVEKKRAAIKAVLSRLQYSVGDSSDDDLQRLGPDAVEVALAGMLRHASQQPRTPQKGSDA